MSGTDLYAVFRPRRGRVVPLVIGAATLVIFVVVALRIPGGGRAGWTGVDRALLMGFGLLIALVLWRFARVRAVPTEQGLTVHNLLVVRELEWAEIVAVQFGGGASWPHLELTDLDSLAVMAIQRSDGEFAQEEARRLATLVDRGSRPHGAER